MCSEFIRAVLTSSTSRHHTRINASHSVSLLIGMLFSFGSNLCKGDNCKLFDFTNGKNQSCRLALSFPSFRVQFQPRARNIIFFSSISQLLNFSEANLAKSNVFSMRSFQSIDSLSSSFLRIWSFSISSSICFLSVSYPP